MEDVRRIDDIKRVSLLVITVLKGKGTENDLCRHVNQYYQEDKNGNFTLLFEDDPCKKKEQN